MIMIIIICNTDVGVPTGSELIQLVYVPPNRRSLACPRLTGCIGPDTKTEIHML